MMVSAFFVLVGSRS